MKNPLLLVFCLVTSAVVAAPTDTPKDKPAEASTEAPKDKPASAPAIDEHSRLKQDYAAARAKFYEARAAAKARAKKARDEKNEHALQAAQDELVRLEKKFAQDNADLVRQLKTKDTEKNPRSRPNNGG